MYFTCTIRLVYHEYMVKTLIPTTWKRNIFSKKICNFRFASIAKSCCGFSSCTLIDVLCSKCNRIVRLNKTIAQTAAGCFIYKISTIFQPLCLLSIATLLEAWKWWYPFNNLLVLMILLVYENGPFSLPAHL